MVNNSIQNLYPNKSSFIFELSGEHKSLPRAEIIACIEAEEVKFKIEDEDPGVLIIGSEELKIEALKERLALTHCIDRKLFSCEVDELQKIKEGIEIGEGSFAVRARRIQNHHEELNLKHIEKNIADLVKEENMVDLSNPDIEIRVIVTSRCHVGVRLADIDRSSFERRKVQHRPHFSPISLHPRLARALVNLSRVKAGQSLLDPFCGTGGVLIEASLIGAEPKGSDVDGRMVKGCRRNLESMNIDKVELFCADVSEVGNYVEEVDAIATDPPYGRSATTNREEISSLYRRAFETFRDILRLGGYLAIVLPNKESIAIGKDLMSLKESHAMRVHKSLTRNFCVFRK